MLVDNSDQNSKKIPVKKLTSVKGMNDILPPDSARWEHLEDVVRSVMREYAYHNLRTPIVEPTALFVRGLGQVTDIVEKEMYSFEDRLNGEHLTLRPEGTAGVVRAVIEHSMVYEGGKRIYYMGPMFRHERPQRGRYRQFHQIGAEVLGFPGAEVDAELILLATRLWKKLGLAGIRLQINSLGQPAERAQHKEKLIAYFEDHIQLLDEDARRRMYTNPLRVLDSKNPTMQTMVDHAPKLIDFLGEESIRHFDRLKEILLSNSIEFEINHRLVRGMDYYNLTVFEFVTDQLGAQGTICGGGRYDYLVEQMGGKSTPAVGWALGIERVLDLLSADQSPVPMHVDAYAVIADADCLLSAVSVIETLRDAGVSVQMQSAATADGSMPSLKSQFKKADASGARFALVFGPDEQAKGVVTIKSLRDGVQMEHAMASMEDWAHSLKKI